MYVLSGCVSPLNFVMMMLEVIAGMVICLVAQMVFIFAVHEVDAYNVVIQLVDNVHWVSELLPFDVEIYLIDSNGIHCIPGSGDAALCVGNFFGFLVPKSGVEGSAVHAGDGRSCVE